MQFTITIPDELGPYLTAAAQAAGEPDLPTAVKAHLASLIRDTAKQVRTQQAMAQVSDQVQQDLLAVDAQNDRITVDSAPDPQPTPA